MNFEAKEKIIIPVIPVMGRKTGKVEPYWLDWILLVNVPTTLLENTWNPCVFFCFMFMIHRGRAEISPEMQKAV